MCQAVCQNVSNVQSANESNDHPKTGIAGNSIAARLKNEIIQAPTVTVNQVLMWTDSTTVLQLINSNEKQRILVTNGVCEILEYIRVDQLNHVAG